METCEQSRGYSLMVVLHSLRIFRILHFVSFFCSILSVHFLVGTLEKWHGIALMWLLSVLLQNFINFFFTSSLRRQRHEIEITRKIMMVGYVIMTAYCFRSLIENGFSELIIYAYSSMIACYVFFWIMEESIFRTPLHTPKFINISKSPFCSSVLYCFLIPLETIQNGIKFILDAAGYYPADKIQQPGEEEEAVEIIDANDEISSQSTDEDIEEQEKFYERSEEVTSMPTAEKIEDPVIRCLTAAVDISRKERAKFHMNPDMKKRPRIRDSERSDSPSPRQNEEGACCVDVSSSELLEPPKLNGYSTDITSDETSSNSSFEIIG